ncbi:hypothetical protein EB093_08285, partial [bacterium]|nr:hypothetical protein [bacterium]
MDNTNLTDTKDTVGTLAHEVGHQLDKTGGEASADRTATLMDRVWERENKYEGTSGATGTSESQAKFYQANRDSRTVQQGTQVLENIEHGEGKVYLNKENDIVAADGVNDHKVQYVNFWQSALLKSQAGENGVANVKAGYPADGATYDMGNANDAEELTKRTDMSFYNGKGEVINLTEVGGDNVGIYYVNGMQNTAKDARHGAEILSDLTGQKVEVLHNETGGLVSDVAEYSKGLTLKDAINTEALQNVAKNGDEKNLVVMFSAGNEDMNKAMQVLALQGGSLENKVDFVSVGSPVGKSDLEKSAGAVDAKIIGQYNTWKDPVTHSKTVGTAVVGLFALGTVLGATEGLGIMSSV